MPIPVHSLFKYLNAKKFGPYTGVPCSILKPVINYAISNEKYYIATSEGEAMGIAAGFSLAGAKPVVMMQNSGFGNTINPLTSLQQIYRLPMLMLITWRGEPAGKPDEPQHRVMGKKLPGFLDFLDVPYKIVGETELLLASDIEYLSEAAEKISGPVAFVIRRGAFEAYPIDPPETDLTLKRETAIQIITARMAANTRIISTTGKTSRELLLLNDTERNFYTVGSMGCASSITLGLALEKPEIQFICLDGDGALLMKMGTLATIGKYRQKNFVYICLDNGAYESTGSQETAASNTDFCQMAMAAQFISASEVRTAEELKTALTTTQELPGPHFIRIMIKCGSRPDLPRPLATPVENRERFMKTL